MLVKVAITFLLIIPGTHLFAQHENANSLSISVMESKLIATGASFKLFISNNTADTIFLPGIMLSHPHNTIALLYEVHFIKQLGDTIDVLKNIYYDIGYKATILWNTKPKYRSLLPGKQIIIDNFISDEVLEKKGVYLVRFSIKQVSEFHNNSGITDNLRTDWIKIIQTKNKSRRNKSNIK